MGRPVSNLRERNRLRTRNDITTAALALFEQRGYDDTTVDQIAKASGVSTATMFRYFACKEDILFADEDVAASFMVAKVAERSDPAISLAALAEPIKEFAADIVDERTLGLTHLVMTNRSLESRSLRMRLRWERELGRRLAIEDGLPTPTLQHSLTAAIAVSCLTTALRYWDKTNTSSGLADLVALAFAESARVTTVA